MSREPVALTWEGGEHEFYLGIKELRAIQDKCDAGPAWIFKRLEDGEWRVDDVIMPIRMGLEGAGMDKGTAKGLIQRHVESEPLMNSVLLAHTIIATALFSPEGDDVGKSTRRPRKDSESGGLNPSLEESSGSA